jgi:hypothetical protein
MLRDGLSGPIHVGSVSRGSSAARFTATLDGVLRAFVHAAEFFDPSPAHSAAHDLQHPSGEKEPNINCDELKEKKRGLCTS